MSTIREALEAAASMLSAVAGDIEDGLSPGDLRGKYVTALINARDNARAALSTEPGGWPGEGGVAVVEDGNIIIRVPIDALPIAFDANPETPRDDEADALYHVSDAKVFAKELCYRLNDEEEDGTTPVHRMLDAAMLECVEQGDEGISEGPLPAPPANQKQEPKQ